LKLNKLLVGILAIVVISGTASLAFAQSDTHSSDAVTGAPNSGSQVGTAGAFDTTASINYCTGQQCHIDYQDPDGVGSTFSTSMSGFGSVNGVLDFPNCPVGTFGVFNGAWSHPNIGDPLITATDCAGFTTCWDLQSSSVIVEVACTRVGGELLPIDTTALVLAGLQTSAIWMLPILAGAAGIGAYYIKTRMNKE